MSFEALFLLLYADLLLLVALGLHRLGRINPSPWRSRVLAGHRRHHPDAGTVGPDTTAADGRGAAARPNTWPHAEQPRLHTGVALVAATAGLVLTIAGLWRHHRIVEQALLAATTTASCAVIALLGNALRRQARSTRPDSGCGAARPDQVPTVSPAGGPPRRGSPER